MFVKQSLVHFVLIIPLPSLSLVVISPVNPSGEVIPNGMAEIETSPVVNPSDILIVVQVELLQAEPLSFGMV